MDWSNIVFTVLPTVIGAIPGMPPVLVPTIVTGIHDVQQMRGASGAEKKAHVLNMVEAAITAVNQMRPGVQPLNVTQIMPIVEGAIDTGIAVVKVMEGHKS